MASYETEHNVDEPRPFTSRRVRPDFSTFFSNLDQADTSQTRNQNANPTPVAVSGVFRTALEGYQQYNGGNSDSEVWVAMVNSLANSMENPPERIKGVSEQFMTDLERVPKESLRKTDDCPICGEPFLDDQYPLVVKLPCHSGHLFDLECIQPWLKVNPTCPLDRKDFSETKPPPILKNEDEEEDYDDLYA